MSERPPLIQAYKLGRVYRTRGEETHALRSVTATVYTGEYISLMGPSGSGKSTFFNMIGALDRPTTGSIQVGGRDLQQMSAHELAYLRCAYLGYIFQNYNLVEVISARENVILPMRFLGKPEEECHRRAGELLERVGLGHRMDHLPGELSGGQQQRVAIARALANDPALVLADEPTGNLDTKTATSIVDLLHSLSKENGVTIVSATHDHRMLKVSDRVLYLRDGSIERIALRDELEIEVGHIDD